MGIDIGGTFTDLVLLGTAGHALTVKVPSTPDDYSRSIAESLEVALPRIGVSGREIEEVIHGTTVATNAILEKRGVRTGLVTTAGFRDVLEIRRLRMPRLYDLKWQKPEALAARIDRVEVTERIDHTGRDPSVRSTKRACTPRSTGFLRTACNPSPSPSSTATPMTGTNGASRR